MLSTFLCHIVPYGRLCAVLELHWHHGYLKRSGKGQKKNLRPFICFTLCFCLSVLHKHRHSYLLNYLIVVVFLHISVCFALLCTYCLCMCMWGIFMQTEPPLCVCVLIGWVHAGAGTQWQMGNREAFYICWRICIVTATAARVSCLLSSQLLCPPSPQTFVFT